MLSARARKKTRFIILSNCVNYAFAEYLKAKDVSYLRVGTNPNPLLSCYNSVPTFIKVLNSKNNTKDLFYKVISDLKSNDLNYLFETFGFSNYLIQKEIFNKILFASLLGNNPEKISRIKTTKDLKNILISDLDLIDKLDYLSREEKEKIKTSIFENKKMHMLSYLYSVYDPKIYKTIFNNGILEKGKRKFGESYKIVNYIILNHQKIILIWNRWLIKPGQSVLRSIITDYKFFDDQSLNLDVDLLCEDIKFILHYTLGLLEFYEFELTITDEELNNDFIIKQINNHRKENGISLKKEIWFYHISFEIDYLK